MRPCFTFKAATETTPPVLDIDDEIGFYGVQAKDFIAGLDAIVASGAKAMDMRINSPGGDVFAGLAIYNALKNSGITINAKVIGLAASAASVIAMAGDSIEMPENSFMMVHNPWSFAMGNADELRETADTLDKIGSSLQGIYVARSGQPAEKVAELLSKDTWLTAAEAKELGFATVVTPNVEAKAKFDLARADLPEAVRKVFASTTTEPPKPADPPAPSPAPEPVPAPAPAADEPIADQVLALAKAGGVEAHGAAIALAATTLADARARIANAREIVALCGIAKQQDKAASFVQANKSVADVRAALIEAQAAGDVHTSNVPKSGAQQPAAKAVKPTSQVYAERNAARAAKARGRK